MRRGKRALDRMVSGNLRMVAKISHKYTHIVTSMTFDDILQEGTIGLCRAAEKYDPGRGYKFSTYAYWWIKQSIHRAIGDKERIVRIPCNALESVNQAVRWRDEYQQKTGRMPTIDQIAKNTRLSVEGLVPALRAYYRGPSLDLAAEGKNGEPGRSSIVDVLSDANAADPLEAVEYELNKEKFERVFQTLPKIQQEVVSEYHGLGGKEPANFTVMSKKRGVSREAVSQQYHRAIRTISVKARNL